MKYIESIKKKIYCTALLLPAALMVAAQDAPSAAPAEPKSNLLAILMTVVAVVLAFIIWGMGQVLISVSRLALEKHKNGGKLLSLLLIGGLLLSSQSGFAQTTDATAAKASDALNYGGLSAHNFYAFVGVFVIEAAAIIFLTFSIRRVYQELLPESAKAAHQSKLSSWWDSLDKKFFTKAVPVEKEADVMLDHDYDGIRELDNSLPPWWKYGFYVTILVAVIYIFLFHVSGDGKNPTQEYAAEMEKAKIEKEKYDANNKDKVDEKNVPMADATGIKAGQELFDANCIACHVKGAGGSQSPESVGPNLTDDYWLHKGSLNDIFHTIKYGYPDKGMQPWGNKFSPKEISFIASYIKSVKGSNPPNAKKPQGELYADEPAADAAPAKADSAKAVVAAVVKDSTSKSK